MTDLLFLFFHREVGEIEGLVSDGRVHAEDIVNGSFEVAGGVVALGHEESVSLAVDRGMEDVLDLDSYRGWEYRDEHFDDRPEELEGGLDFGLRIGGLDIGADHGDVERLGTDGVAGGHTGDVDVVLAADLLLRNDDLTRGSVFGVGNGVLQETDAPDDLADLLESSRNVHHVAGVADDHGGEGSVGSGADSDDLPTLHQDLVSVRPEHVGAPVDGGQSGEAFRNAPEPVDGVQEGRVTVAAHGVGVETDLLDHGPGGTGQELVGEVEGC